MAHRFLPYMLYSLAGLLYACTAGKDSPDDYLTRAREMVRAEQYQMAKMYLDSIRILFPDDLTKIKEGMKVMREVDFAEQQRTLAFCDSVLKQRQTELPMVSKNFVFEKNAEYERLGHYFYKTQKYEDNFGRTFLQSKVDEKGRLVITSYYSGSTPIHHTRFTAYNPQRLFAQTQPVAKDGAMNYSFEDDGTTYEIVRYNYRTENGVVNFMLEHLNEPISIELNGIRNHQYSLAQRDKEALKAAVDLSVVLSDINRLLDEMRLAQAKMEYILSRKDHPVEEPNN
ncbi:MAG: hypothetical protein AB7D40_07595 [Bacteroidales bacterium]